LQSQKAKLLMGFAKEFGFTPGSQSRIAVVPEKTAEVADPLAAAGLELQQPIRPSWPA